MQQPGKVQCSHKYLKILLLHLACNKWAITAAVLDELNTKWRLGGRTSFKIFKIKKRVAAR